MIKRILYVCIKYVWPNLWRHRLLFEVAIRVKSMYMIKSWLKTRKKYGNHIYFFYLSPSIKWFMNEIHSSLGRADARRRADIIYRMWRISLLCAPGIVNGVTKLGHAQNIWYKRIILCGVIDTLIWRRNLISVASFNTIFFIIYYWLTSKGHHVCASPYFSNLCMDVDGTMYMSISGYRQLEFESVLESSANTLIIF